MFLMYTLHSSTCTPFVSMQIRSRCTNILLPGVCDFKSLEATALGLWGRAQEECSLAWHRLEFLESGARGGHTQKRNASQPAPAAPRRATMVRAGLFHDSVLAGAGALQKGAGPKRGCHPAASTQVAPERLSENLLPQPGTWEQPRFLGQSSPTRPFTRAPCQVHSYDGKNSDWEQQASCK